MTVLAHVGADAGTVVMVLLLCVLAAGYAVGQARQPVGAARRRRTEAFAVALMALLAALGPPLEDLSHHRFAAHMGQHLLLVSVAAPGLALAGVPRTLALAVDGSARRAVHRSRPLGWWRRLARRSVVVAPLVAAAVYLLVLAAWHVPALYDAAVRGGPLHLLEHATLLGAAAALWAAVLAARQGGGAGAAFAALFVASIASGLLGALLTFAPSPIYRSYVDSSGGMTALEDQQLAGVLMWVPGGLVYVAGALTVVALALGRAGRRREQGDRAARRVEVLVR